MNQAYRDLKESLVGGSPSEVFLAGMAFDKLVEEYERYEEALRQIANDSRPCLWDADHAAEHWKHVASQRREWAIEALHHISLEDTNEDGDTPINLTRSSISGDEDPREKRGAFGRNPGWE
jgi:hypothetical protein